MSSLEAVGEKITFESCEPPDPILPRNFSFGCRGIRFLHHSVVRKRNTRALHRGDRGGGDGLGLPGHHAHAQLPRARQRRARAGVPRRHPPHPRRQARQRVEGARQEVHRQVRRQPATSCDRAHRRGACLF